MASLGVVFQRPRYTLERQLGMQNVLFGSYCRNRGVYIDNSFDEAKVVRNKKAVDWLKANISRAVVLHQLGITAVIFLMNCFVRVASSQSSYKHIPL